MISIVVPVYNSGKYLEPSLNSILDQSYRDFELILVDDGSTDGSGKVCDRYAEKDKRISVIHQVNAGPSVARNTGMACAKGRYLLWVDGDDLLPADALETWNNLITYNDADMALGKVVILREGESVDDEAFSCEEAVITGEDALVKVFYGQLTGTTACGLLMKTEIARQYPFPVGKYHEDDRTSFKYYLASKRVAVIDKGLYYYIQREGSIMHRTYGQPSIDELEAGDYIVEQCAECEPAIRKAAEYKRFCNYMQVFSDTPDLKNLDPENYKRICSYFETVCGQILKDANSSKRMRIYALAWKLGRERILRIVERL